MAYGLIVQKFTIEQLFIRLAIISAYFIGWLLGRIVIGDNKPIRMFFNDGHNDMGRIGHRHPALKERKSNYPITMNDDLIEKAGHRYIGSPRCIDGAIPNQSHNKEKWSFFANEYELEPEPFLPVLSKDYADTLFNDIVTTV